jgi:uncharacterized protein
MRWWDGTAWGPAAPPWSFGRGEAGDPVQEGSTLSVLSHVGYFVAGFILPLIFRLTEGRKNEYVRHHSTEALNFQLTWFAGWVTGFVAVFVSLIAFSDGDGNPTVWFFLIWFGMAALYVTGAVFSVIGAIRAGRGEWWRYPVNIRFVRGARPLA